VSIKNVDSLRNFLAEQLEKLTNGEVKPDVANACAMLSANMLLSINLEMKYNQMQNKQPNIKFMEDNSNLIVQENKSFPIPEVKKMKRK
jgi:hypothetical protein